MIEVAELRKGSNVTLITPSVNHAVIVIFTHPYEDTFDFKP